MVNTKKQIQGCRENPELKTISFRNYVVGFCESQVASRTVTCSVCGKLSICTSTNIDEDVVHGVFKCSECHHKDYKRVDMVVLKSMFDTARKGRLLWSEHVNKNAQSMW